jgi:hypothetical protein
LLDVKSLSDARRTIILGGFVRESFFFDADRCENESVVDEFKLVLLAVSASVEVDEESYLFIAIVEESSDVVILFVSIEEVSNVLLVLLVRDDSVELCSLFVVCKDTECCVSDKFNSCNGHLLSVQDRRS